MFTEAPIVRGTRFREQIIKRWAAWEKLSDKELDALLLKYAAEHRRLLDRKTDVEQTGKRLSEQEQARLKELEFEGDLGDFERGLRQYEGQPWKKTLNPAIRERERIGRFRTLVNKFLQVLTEARNERIEQLRALWPKLPNLCVEGKDLLKVDLDEGHGLVARAALLNRLDLMNARAQLVDAWRQIALFANALLGTVNVAYNLTSFTPAGQAKPLAFGDHRNEHQVFINTELPLTRKVERNNYRASLIGYQRQRRVLMEAEDLAIQTTRGELRQLRVNAANFDIQKRQVELAYLTVENSLDTLNAPPAPTAAGAAGVDLQTRAAALTQQLLMTQRQLYQTQLNVISVWITYLNTRLQLYRDMELMPLDSRGVWTDEYRTRDCDAGDGCQPAGTGSPSRPEQPKQPAGPKPEPKRPERLPEPKPEAGRVHVIPSAQPVQTVGHSN
jgi:hypothetical protein